MRVKQQYELYEVDSFTSDISVNYKLHITSHKI